MTRRRWWSGEEEEEEHPLTNSVLCGVVGVVHVSC